MDHRSNNIPHTVENVVHTQPSVSHKEDENQNSNFEHVPSKRPSEDPEEDDRKPAAKRIKKEPEDDAQSVTQDEPKVETIVKPWEDKKDYEAIFRKYISIGDDGEEQYDMIDMERDAQVLHPTCDGRETMHNGCETFASSPLDGQTREGANAHKPRAAHVCV